MPKESTKISVQKQKILVYGSTGLVGGKIIQLIRNKYKIIAPPHHLLDLKDKKIIHSHLKDILPDQIVYSAGLTKVDDAQLNPKLAYYLNHLIPAYIATRAAKLKIPFHYLSSDAVFNGEKSNAPYKETDKPSPISVYGDSKLKGEIATLSASDKNSVIRTELIYAAYFPHKKDFARVAYESLKRGESFEGIVDQTITPTFVDDLVFAIAKILEKRATGIYHVASTDSTTNYKFLVSLAEIFRLNKHLIKKIEFEEFFAGKAAKRARYCWLDTTKFQNKVNSRILKKIKTSLKEFKRQILKVDSLPIDL